MSQQHSRFLILIITLLMAVCSITVVQADNSDEILQQLQLAAEKLIWSWNSEQFLELFPDYQWEESDSQTGMRLEYYFVADEHVNEAIVTATFQGSKPNELLHQYGVILSGDKETITKMRDAVIEANQLIKHEKQDVYINAGTPYRVIVIDNHAGNSAYDKETMLHVIIQADPLLLSLYKLKDELGPDESVAPAANQTGNPDTAPVSSEDLLPADTFADLPMMSLLDNIDLNMSGPEVAAVFENVYDGKCEDISLTENFTQVCTADDPEYVDVCAYNFTYVDAELSQIDEMGPLCLIKDQQTFDSLRAALAEKYAMQYDSNIQRYKTEKDGKEVRIMEPEGMQMIGIQVADK